MGEHSSKVEYRRKVLNAEIWAKKTKEIMMVAKGNGIKKCKSLTEQKYASILIMKWVWKKVLATKL